MNVPFVVPFYAAIFALIYIGLTIRVIMLRNTKHVSLGNGGDPVLERAIRIHANFIEYVPLALILLTTMEMQRRSIYVLHSSACYCWSEGSAISSPSRARTR